MRRPPYYRFCLFGLPWSGLQAPANHVSNLKTTRRMVLILINAHHWHQGSDFCEKGVCLIIGQPLVVAKEANYECSTYRVCCDCTVDDFCGLRRIGAGRQFERPMATAHR